MEVLNEQIITDSEAKDALENRGKLTELKHEQKNSMDVLKKTTKNSPEQIAKLVEALKVVDRLREKQIIAIANFLPEDKDDLRAILHKEYTTLTPEETDKVLSIIKENI